MIDGGSVDLVLQLEVIYGLSSSLSVHLELIFDRDAELSILPYNFFYVIGEAIKRFDLLLHETILSEVSI